MKNFEDESENFEGNPLLERKPMQPGLQAGRRPVPTTRKNHSATVVAV